MLREIKLTIKENSYTVEFPKTGKLIAIENMKAILSNGMYGSMESARTLDSQFALDIIDMEAYFSVLIPKLMKDLRIDSIKDLHIEDSLEIRAVFMNQFLPFIKQWRDIIAKAVNPPKDTEQSDD